MCGIVGQLAFEVAGERRLGAALEKITHRGPDSLGTHIDAGLAMGMRRLAIIDVDGGIQPQSTPDGKLTVVFNGEIYNHVELRRELTTRGHQFRTESDTEVILHGYREYGTDLFSKLRGMFAIALWVKPEQRLILARDRFGKKPLYYVAEPDGGVAFASELKALLPLLGERQRRPKIRAQGVYDYLSLGVVPQPDTIYEGVKLIPPAHWATFHLGDQPRVEQYWELSRSPKSARSFAENQQRARALLSDAVNLRLRSDVPLGVFLSGGVDSSIVAYEAARQRHGDLDTYTIKVSDQGLDESDVAQRTARALGVRNTVLHLDVEPEEELHRIVAHFDQPFADSSAIPSLAVARLARQHVKVVLNGDGGDELFAGYRRYLAAAAGPLTPILERLPAPPNPAARRTALGFVARTLRGFRESGGARYLTWTTDMLFERDKHDAWLGGTVRATELGLEPLGATRIRDLDDMLDADRRINLLSDLLVKMDMATMAASLEARSPLLDHELAEFAARLPTSQLIRHGQPKAILRSAYRDVLPREVVAGKKRGFEIPLDSWLATAWRPLIHDTLLARDAEIANFLEPSFVRMCMDDSALADRNQKYIRYALLVLELWLRQQRGAAATTDDQPGVTLNS